ncbi:hypothetical protein ON010_g2778 [Phytophthora cinnamomi]|nr:hypothetical protein ON010_g2778 [Phytophthora cinnamomi]
MRLQSKKVFAKVASGHAGEPYYGPTLKRMHLVRRFFLVLLRKRFSKLPADVKSCCLLDPQFAHGKYYRDDEKAAAGLFVENEALRLAGAVVVDVDLSMSVDMSSEDEDDFTSELLGLTRKALDQEHESAEDVTLRDKVKAEIKI